MLHSTVCQPFCCNTLFTLALGCLESMDSSTVHSDTVCFGIDGQEQKASAHFCAIGRSSRSLGTASLLQWTPLFWRRGPPKDTQQPQHTRRHRHRRTHKQAHMRRQPFQTGTHYGYHANKKKVHMNDKRTSYEPRKKFI